MYLFVSFIATEKDLLSVLVERQREMEILQEIITSLTLKLNERDKENEELKQSLKSKKYIGRYLSLLIVHCYQV